MTRVRQAGERIEELLATPAVGGRRVPRPRRRSWCGCCSASTETGSATSWTPSPPKERPATRVSDRLLADPLVESLLLLHDLHPLDVDTRIQRALDRVRPYLGSHAGGVEYLGAGADGVARLRLEGSCHGCPSSTVTVRLAIEGAVEDAAPEVTEVVVEGMTEPPGPQLLQIGRRPSDAAASGPTGSPPAGPAGDPGWVSLPAIGPPDGRPVAAEADGVPIVVCSVRGTLYAYCDACAACGSSLAGGTLTGERLDCPGCGAGYDVRSAGRGLDDPGRHLDPLPLLTDSQGIRVALAGRRSPVDRAARFPGGRAAGPAPLSPATRGRRSCRPRDRRSPATGPAGPGTPAASPRGAGDPARRRARPRRPVSCARRRSAPSTAIWPTWSTPPSTAPAAPATCCSPGPAPAAAGTAPSRSATCAIPPAR